MKLLLDNRLAPITSRLGFLQADCDAAVAAFLDWQSPLANERGVRLVKRPVHGSLEQVLRQLTPLTSVAACRYLFVPTRSNWTAYFDNGHQGSGAPMVMSYLAQSIGCTGISALAVPHTLRGSARDAKGCYGGLSFEVFGPKKTDFLHYVRTVELINDGGSWVFGQSGPPLSFEDTKAYAESSKRKRFTFEMLERYLTAMGVQAFREDEYLMLQGKAIFIEKLGLSVKGMREFSLEEARAKGGYDV